MKKKLTKFLFFALLFLHIVPFKSIAKDEIPGEIININYKYKIAFTDLGNSHLHPGDILKVRKGNAVIGYLEVSESSTAISRLIPIKNHKEYNTEVIFNKITIGDTVIKITAGEKQKKLHASKGSHRHSMTSKNKMKNAESQTKKNTIQQQQPIENISNMTKYYDLLEKHNEIIKTLINEKSKKRLLQAQNGLLNNEIISAKEKIKNLKLENSKLKNKVNQIKSSQQNASCQIKLNEAETTLKKITNKLNTLKKHIEGN